MATLKLGGRNACAVSSAVLELLAFIEKVKLTSLIEHIYINFYAHYKKECPIVFEAIRKKYEESFETAGGVHSAVDQNNLSVSAPPMTAAASIFGRNDRGTDTEDESYWEKDNEPAETETGLSDSDVPSPHTPQEEAPKWDEQEQTHAQNKGSSDLIPLDQELKLPERKKSEEEDEGQSFFGATRVHAQRKDKSPQYKSMFQKISWKGAECGNDKKNDTIKPVEKTNDIFPEDNDEPMESSSLSPLVSKRKREVPDSTESLMKKTKPCASPMIESS